MNFIFEGCCTSVADAVNAQHSGAARIELCEELEIGGVTPSEALLRETLLALAEDALAQGKPCLKVNVLVRPRGGDFVYSEAETARMLDDIELCKRLTVRDSAGGTHRVNGVVIGALRPGGSIDTDTTRRLIDCARRLDGSAQAPEHKAPALEVTFHRAFDVCSDVDSALEDIIGLGCERILTSGHAPDAYQGRFTLRHLVQQAAGRIVILAGGGIRPHNIAEIAAVSHAPEYHSSTLVGW